MKTVIKRPQRPEVCKPSPGSFINDTAGMSLKAVGLYAFLLQFPEKVDFKFSCVTNHFTDGITSATAALKELIAAGFVSKKTVRVNGRVAGVQYTLHVGGQLSENKD